MFDHAYAISYPGAIGVILGPTNDNLKQTTTRKFFEILETMPGGRDAYEHSWNKTDRHFVYKHPTRTVSLKNGATRAAAGSEVLFRGLDDERVVDRIRGMEIAWYHMDEGPLCPPYAFDVLAGRLRQQPSAAERALGIAEYPHLGRITGTHKGKDWVFRRFGCDGKGHGVGLIVHTSVRDNAPNLPPGYLESLYSLYQGEWAKQELEGLHAKFEGLVYSIFDTAIHVYAGPRLKLDWQGIGVDWGYHYAPLIKGGWHNRTDQFVINEEWYGHLVTLPDQIEAARAMLVGDEDANRFFPDPSRPENIVEFTKHGFYCPEFEPGKVDEGILYGTSLMAQRATGEPGLLVHESCVNFISEIEGYQWATWSGTGDDDPNRFKREPAKGQADHALDAARYLWMGLRKAEVSSERIDPVDTGPSLGFGMQALRVRRR